jgi:hypothetical protein
MRSGSVPAGEYARRCTRKGRSCAHRYGTRGTPSRARRGDGFKCGRTFS